LHGDRRSVPTIRSLGITGLPLPLPFKSHYGASSGDCFDAHACIITGPPTHSVVGRLVTVGGVCRRLSSVVRNTAHVQRNSPGAARGGPVVLRPVRATPFFELIMQLYIRKRVPISNALGLVFMAVFLDGSSPTYHLFVSMSKDDNELSSWYTFSCGVLPGSVLDPLLLYFSLNSGSHTGSVSLYPPLELTTRRTASKFFCALYWRRRANMSTASVAVLA